MTAEALRPAIGAAANHTFLNAVLRASDTEPGLEACIQCGTCGGSCPSAVSMDHTPRALFALVLAGMRDEALRSNTPWMCLSCYFCTVRCPKGIRIPDVMYGIKSIAVRERLSPERTGADFSSAFVDNIHRFGRSYEMGLVARHYLRHHPLRLPGLTGMGLSMVAHGRMGFRPQRIKRVDGLRAILDRAAQLEEAPNEGTQPETGHVA